MAVELFALKFSDVLLSCAVIALVWLIIKVVKAKLVQKRPLPPCPPPHWLFGNAAVFRSNPEERHLRLFELHKKYGKVVRIQMGRPPIYGGNLFSIADPALCEQIVKSKACETLRSEITKARFRDIIGKNGLVILEGEEWRRHRRLIMPLFRHDFLKYALQVTSHKTQVAVKKLQESPDGSSVEAFTIVQRLALDIISEAAFGYDLKVQENTDDSETVKALLSFLGRLRELSFLVFPSLYFWMHPFKALHAHKLQTILDSFINQMIQQRKRKDFNEDKKDLLMLLLRAQDPESNCRLTDAEVHDEILTFLIGGFETTSSQMCWILYHMAQNPEIQATAQEEVDRVLGDSDVVTSEMENELKYVAKCIKESQRLIPVVTGFFRGAGEDIELGGYHIPKDSALFLNAYVLQHMKVLWDNPEEFDPTRWDDKMAIRTFSFLPFGSGSRRCAGQSLAVVEMKAVIAMILRNFSLKLDESKPIVTKVEAAYGPRQIHFFLSKRK